MASDVKLSGTRLVGVHGEIIGPEAVGAASENATSDVLSSDGTSSHVFQYQGADAGTVSIRRNDDLGVSNPKLQFIGYNATWRLGMDNANGVAGTDFVPVVLANTAGDSVQDFLYASFQGTAGNYPTDTATTLIRLGVGVTPPSTGYRLQTAGGSTSNNPSVGGVRSLVNSGQTGHAYVMEASSGTARWWVDSGGYMSGAHETMSCAIAIQANVTQERPLVMLKNAKNAAYGFQYSSNSMGFHYFSGGVESWRVDTDGGFRHLSSEIGFYGTVATAKQTVSGSRGGNAALASLLTALAAIGLLTDSSTA